LDARILIVPAGVLLAGYRARRLRARGMDMGTALGLKLDMRSVVEVLGGVLVSTLSLFTVFLGEWHTGLLTVRGLGPVWSLVHDWSTPVVVAFVEEFVFRSALLGVLLFWMTVPVAVTVSATAFAVVHLGNVGVGALAIVCYFMGGVIYGIAFVKTQRLWLPFGLHLGWNFAAGRLLGFALSGSSVAYPFVLQHNNGPDVWTGGTYGLEGGILGLVAKVIVGILLFAWLGLTTNPTIIASGPTMRCTEPPPSA
jgi:uncharacterized protein